MFLCLYIAIEKAIKIIPNFKPNKYKTNTQNIIKIIPTNVRLVNISSNDNKYVTIKASSTEYEDLGYFFAQIKLENVLNNAKIVKVENGETTTVEIGGDLPWH